MAASTNGTIRPQISTAFFNTPYLNFKGKDHVIPPELGIWPSNGHLLFLEPLTPESFARGDQGKTERPQQNVPPSGIPTPPRETRNCSFQENSDDATKLCPKEV